MGSLRRWRMIGGGDFRPWGKEGDELEGLWLGSHSGQYGPLGCIETLDGRVTFPLNAVLLQRLETVPAGRAIRIVYRGLGSTKQGRPLNLFDVYVAVEDEEKPEGEVPV